MTLLDHLKSAGETIPGFAKRLGEPENTIRKIAYGQRQPSLPLAVKISEATGGLVPPQAMVLPAPADGMAA